MRCHKIDFIHTIVTPIGLSHGTGECHIVSLLDEQSPRLKGNTGTHCFKWEKEQYNVE